MTVKEILCSNLKKYRKGHGWTQKELSEKITVNPVTVSGWELGNKEPSFEMLDNLAALFGVPVSALFSEGGSGFAIAESYAAFLKSLCAFAASPWVGAVKLETDVKTTALAPDGTTFEMNEPPKLVLDVSKVFETPNFADLCKGTVALVTAYKSNALPKEPFVAAVSGLLSSAAEAEEDREINDFAKEMAGYAREHPSESIGSMF